MTNVTDGDGLISLDQIAATLRVSRASASTNARLLHTIGLAERMSLPGDRRDYYVFGQRAWERSIQATITGTQTARRMAVEGLAALGPGETMGHVRLREAVAFAELYEAGLKALLEQWRARAASPSPLDLREGARG